VSTFEGALNGKLPYYGLAGTYCQTQNIPMYGMWLTSKYLYICIVHTVVLFQSLAGMYSQTQHALLWSVVEITSEGY
jgi:hypothetical protein